MSRARAVGAAGAVSGRRSWESSSPEPGCKQSWDRPGRCRAPGPGPEPAAPLAPLPDRLNGLLPAGHLPCGMLHHGVSPEVGVLLAEPQGPEHETSREQPRSPRAGALPVRRASLGQSGPGSHTVGGREGGREGGRRGGRKEGVCPASGHKWVGFWSLGGARGVLTFLRHRRNIERTAVTHPHGSPGGSALQGAALPPRQRDMCPRKETDLLLANARLS